MSDLPEDIRRELAPGEQPIWWDRPRQGLVLRGSDVFLIPFSVLWCGFAIFWEASVLKLPNAPVFFVLWGIPFVLIGLYLVVGRFFVEARQRQRTYYALTTDRVLIVSGLLSRKVKSLGLKTLTDVSLEERRSGEGSIAFGHQSAFASIFGGMGGWPGVEHHLGTRFDLIGEARLVYERIRDAQRSAT